MSSVPGRRLVMSSILDRLFDEAPQALQEVPFEARFDVGQHKRAVARDLEALLNARSAVPAEDWAGRYPLAAESILAFGIPDLSSLCLLDPGHRSFLRDRILHAIERFEPRLSGVRVDLDLPGDQNGMLRFRVEAVLRIHPSRPPVVFDALLKLSSNACQIRSQA